MADGGITRRDLLRGRGGRPSGHSGPIVKPGQQLPDLISWLDPEMRATPRRADAAESFPLLRPPGAVAEPDFLAACTRCGDCADACPHDVIVPAPSRLRDAEGTPTVDPLRSPCQMCEDLPCIAACETGALRAEAPAALGRAHVSPLDCLNRLGSSCSVCVERCPVPGALAWADGVPAVEERLCTGCGVCQHVCPAPHNAIAILPNPDRPTSRALDLAAATNETIELPELREAELDADELRALFRDLSALAELLEVRLKRGAGARGEAATVAPDEALAQLLQGDARGAQLRYRHEGREWCDTILAAPGGGHRVVRMESPVRPSGLA